eukprot:g54030.t1
MDKIERANTLWNGIFSPYSCEEIILELALKLEKVQEKSRKKRMDSLLCLNYLQIIWRDNKICNHLQR